MQCETIPEVRGWLSESHGDLTERLVETTQLRLDAGTGELCIAGEARYKLQQRALTQLAKHLQIPLPYFNSCPTHIQAANVNHWLHEKNVRQWLLRFRGDTVRAVLVNRYAPPRNVDVLDALDRIKPESPFRIQSCHIDENTFDLRLDFPDHEASVGLLSDGRSDLLRVGIHVRNSEVGAEPLQVKAMVYRLVCQNGLLPGSPREIFTIKLDADRLTDELARDIRYASQQAWTTVRPMREAHDVRIENPVGYIVAQATRAFSNAFAQECVDAFKREGADATLYCVVNAFTRAAQLHPIDRRIQIETFAGRLLTDHQIAPGCTAP